LSQRQLETMWTNVHASVSMFHSASSLGDEESMDKNSANTSKTAAMAAANIERPHLLQI
jgi:hypothetical protein